MPFKQDSLDFGGAVSADRLVAAANHLTQLANRDEAGLSAHGWSAPRTVELQHILVQLKEVVSLSGRDLVLPELLETAQRLKAARLWGSQLSYYLENALGPNHPALEKVRPPLETWGPDETLHWLDPLLEIARKYEIELSHWGGGSMFNMRGAELRETVRQQCGVVFPGSDLSSSAQRLIQLKSLVHVTLQRLVRCGKALWIDEPLAAGRYHLQFLEPNVPLPLEFTTPGLGVTAGADSLSMLDASVVGDDFEADLRIESLAIGSVLPMGEESVHRVPPGLSLIHI